jgi:hypothetical protein
MKKFKLGITKPKCVQCGSRIQVAKRQSNLNIGKIIGYCYKREKHNRLGVMKFEMEVMVLKDPDADTFVSVKQKKSEYQ